MTQVEATRLLGLRGVGGARRTRAASRAPTPPPRPGPTRRRSRARARPDDRPRRRDGPRPRPRSTRRRSAARRPSARSRSSARASRRAAAARWCSTRSWPPRSWRSSARCCPPTPSSAAARCSRAARARRWPHPALRARWTTPPTRRARPARPFDGEGSPTRRTPLLEGGQLLTFLFDVRTARRAGRETTASASRGSYRSPPSVGTSNLIVSPGRRRPRRSSSATPGQGLYVTDVAGLHSGVNPVSGTFSVGASGRLIEKGRAGRPGTGADDRQRPRHDAPRSEGGGGSSRAGSRSPEASRHPRCSSKRWQFPVSKRHPGRISSASVVTLRPIRMPPLRRRS